MSCKDIIEKYYTPKILLGKPIIDDIAFEMFGKNKKVLVFGLGYDSYLYYHANSEKNIWFVESNDDYIKLNTEIDNKYIVKHTFNNISVASSFNLSDEQIEKFPIPLILVNNAPYDIIIIDAPNGFAPTTPGRLLPIYWTSKLLARKDSCIYIDDTERPLESYCINRFLSGYKQILKNRANAETIKLIK